MKPALKEKLKEALSSASPRMVAHCNSFFGLGLPCIGAIGIPSITSDGYLIGYCEHPDGEKNYGAFLGDAKSLRQNMQGLADHLKLSPVERMDMNIDLSKAQDNSGGIHNIKVF